MSGENWHEERDRLVQLLRGIETGNIMHIDRDDLRELRATTPGNIAVLKARVAQLNGRLGDAPRGEQTRPPLKPSQVP